MTAILASFQQSLSTSRHPHMDSINVPPFQSRILRSSFFPATLIKNRKIMFSSFWFIPKLQDMLWERKRKREVVIMILWVPISVQTSKTIIVLNNNKNEIIVQQTKLKATNQKPWEDQLQIHFGPQPQLPKGLFWQRGKTTNQSNYQKRMIHIMQTIVILAKPKTELNYSNSRPHPHSHSHTHTHAVDQKVVPLLSMNSL